MIARLRNAYRDVWTLPDERAVARARGSGVLVMLVSGAFSFAYMGLVLSTSLRSMVSEDLFEGIITPGLIGLCSSAQGGYRALVGKGIAGSSAFAMATRIFVAMISLLSVCLVMLALAAGVHALRTPDLVQENEPTPR
jgi:hypothetical protein